MMPRKLLFLALTKKTHPVFDPTQIYAQQKRPPDVSPYIQDFTAFYLRVYSLKVKLFKKLFKKYVILFFLCAFIIIF